MDTDLVGSAEAADILGRSRDFVEREVHAGRLTPKHRGKGIRGSMLFDRGDVEALAEAGAAK